MLTIGLMSLRTKKIVSLRFLSIIELFEGQKFTKFSKLGLIDFSRIAYDCKSDTLAIHLKLILSYPSRYLGKVEAMGDAQDRVLTLNEDGSVSILKKLNLMVLKLFCSRTKSIEVLKFTSVRQSRGSIVAGDEKNSIFRVVLKPGETGFKKRENPQGDQHQAKLVRKVINNRVLERLGTQNLGCGDYLRSISQVNEEELLVISQRKMVLFDLNTREILSSIEHNEDLPTQSCNALIDGNLMVEISKNQRKIKIFKILRDEVKGASVKLVGWLNLNQEKNLESFEKLLCLKKFDQNQFVLKALTKWKDQAGLHPPSNSILSVKFEVGRIGAIKENRNLVRLIEESVDWRDLGERVDLSSSIKNGQTNHISLDNEERTFGVQIRPTSEGDVKFVFEKFDRSSDNRRCQEMFIKDDLGFVVSLQGDYKELHLLRFTHNKENNKMNNPELVRSLSVECRFESIFFDKKTEIFRIFTFSRDSRSQDLILKILDEKLQTTLCVHLPGANRIERFIVLSQNVIILIGTTVAIGEGWRERKVVSLILNLKELTFKEIVDQEGAPVLGEAFDLVGRRLVVMNQSDHINFNITAWRGIFISDEWV